GRGRVVWWRSLLVVAFVPDPSSLSSPGGNHRGLAVSSRITRCCGAETPGRTPPVRNDCASTADSDEGSGTTPPVGRGPAPHACELTAACASRSGPRPHHRGGVPDPSSLSAGVAKLAGPVVSSRAFPQASRCDPAGHHRTGLLPLGDDSDEGSGTKATTSNDRQQTTRPAPTPVAERPPEALLLIFGAHQ